MHVHVLNCKNKNNKKPHKTFDFSFDRFHVICLISVTSGLIDPMWGKTPQHLSIPRRRAEIVQIPILAQKPEQVDKVVLTRAQTCQRYVETGI